MSIQPKGHMVFALLSIALIFILYFDGTHTYSSKEYTRIHTHAKPVKNTHSDTNAHYFFCFFVKKV